MRLRNLNRSSYSLAVAIDTEFDSDAMRMLEAAAFERGLSTYLIEPFNLEETCEKVAHGELEFGFYYDRASDTSPEFLRLYHLIQQKQIPWHALNQAADKAFMHQRFTENGIRTPFTITIPPYDEYDRVSLVDADLSRLGRPFVIKPARTTGGGTGVVDGAESLSEVVQARSVYRDNKYLLQERIVPLERDGRRFWFRCFYVSGSVECTWWDDTTHIYEVLSAYQIEAYRLAGLFPIVFRIAAVCGLNFFSTEISLTAREEFVVIDYVNEMCDLRLQSEHHDGVPDEVVRRITGHIAAHVSTQLKSQGGRDKHQ